MTEPRKLLKGETGDWEVVIGLEVHAQVTSKSKLFSGASAEYGAGPNENVSLVDAAMPGMLPVINRYCVEQAVKTGLGLNAKINLWSRFDRKNYFYPDLPQGYQISQYKDPIVGEGEIEVEVDGEEITVGIERLHLEQDAGKSIHDLSPKESYVDLNRSGVALMEIVSRPDMRSADEAAAYFSKLRTILRYLGTCDGNMEEGSMRADVNVSVRRPGDKLGTRTETKNVNSIRYVKQAVEYEARRQIEVIERGGTIDQETRLFDVATGETRTMRSKEDAHDYRYFPDPDLLPLELDQALVERIKASLPELPNAKRHRYSVFLGLNREWVNALAANVKVSDAFDEMILEFVKRRHGESGANWAHEYFGYDATKRQGMLLDPEFSEWIRARLIEREAVHVDLMKAVGMLANWFAGDIYSYANRTNEPADEILSRLNLVSLLDLLDKGQINGKIAKIVLEIMFETGGDPEKIVVERGLKQVTDAGAIEKAVDAIIAANPDQVRAVQEKPKTFGWFVGQVMKSTGGKANPQAVNEILKKKLGV